MKAVEKICLGIAVAIIITTAVLWKMDKIRRQSAPITPELAYAYTVKNSLKHIGYEIQYGVVQTNGYLGFFELPGHLEERLSCAVFVAATNPIPKYLPPGTYGRLVHYHAEYGTNCPLLWWFNKDMNDVMYLTVGGHFRALPRAEFARMVRPIRSEIMFDESLASD